VAALLRGVGIPRLSPQAPTREVIKALKPAAKSHGPGTVARAPADLTAAGELVNPKDKRGYRPAGWKRSKTPSLFDGCGVRHGRSGAGE
jgi:hypothetical protein